MSKPVSVAVSRLTVVPAVPCDACDEKFTEVLAFQLDGHEYIVCEPCMIEKAGGIRMPVVDGGRA